MLTEFNAVPANTLLTATRICLDDTALFRPSASRATALVDIDGRLDSYL
jgi:hypothetical protein